MGMTHKQRERRKRRQKGLIPHVEPKPKARTVRYMEPAQETRSLTRRERDRMWTLPSSYGSGGI